MAKKTVNDLIEHCKKAVKNKVQYIYGAKMEVLSYNQIKKLQEIYGCGNVWIGDLKKAGKLCCDCSGLISSCTGIVRNSTGYKNTALKTITLKELKKNWEKYVGWGLWLQGHIGVVSDTKGYYYAMDGSARNMVHYPLNKQNWTMAIKLCDIDYTEHCSLKKKEQKGDDEVIETGYINVNGKNIKINKILKDGSNFIELRGLENAGFKVGYNKDTKLVTLDNKVSSVEASIGGELKSMETININGYNFVKLRDVAHATEAFDVTFENGKVAIIL